ncbi:uncharacterized protein LOC122849346 [Aphidius gifuensis]|uniref:uncharacterized protein LOC122849346 n=1 Tax=Aphidius gifuensis TaxID=684658 RepID=UPI001CDB923C|nr:uncharacterized protein LOC122849346 [Aphidius gifuensis]
MYICTQLECLSDTLIHHDKSLSNSRFIFEYEKLSSPAMGVQCVQNILSLCVVSLELSFIKYDHSQKPIKITGGPFYILSLETFKSLTALCLSNAVILRQLSEET